MDAQGSVLGSTFKSKSYVNGLVGKFANVTKFAGVTDCEEGC